MSAYPASPAHRHVTTPSATEARVAKRSGSLLLASASATSTSAATARRRRVIHVGGASSYSPASRRAMASAGESHP